jgi:hypothetical protein
MTEKRFTYEYDEFGGILFDNKMKTFYHIEDSEKNIEIFCERLNSLVYKNELLTQQRHEWVNSVKREEIDKIFKMSIFEIAEAFDYYKERIKELEKRANGD